jgi:hypothetical protein
MPEVSGRDLAEQVRSIIRLGLVLVMSGYSEASLVPGAYSTMAWH